MTTERSNIEILIPTFNEEINLPHALRSIVEWADTVYVVDSESTDRTRQIAEEMGATVVVQKWLGYARQKNWALETLPWKSDWVFILDADEVITPELRDELLAIARRPVDEVAETGYYINRLTKFLGKPIRHCGYFPSYNLRFFKKGRASYEDREVHEHMVVEGETGRLRHLMLHEDRRGLEHFIAKHNRYSTLEARELLLHKKERDGKRATELERGVAIRRWLKYNVQPRLPLPGLWRFLYMYIFKLGFLDGATGFRFALMLSMYDFFIALKLAELKSLIDERGATTMAETKPSRTAGLAQEEGSLAPPASPPTSPTASPDSAAATATSLAPPAASDTGADAPVGAATGGRPEASVGAAAAKVEVRRDANGRRDDRREFSLEDLAARETAPVSVIVLTYNEEGNIRACLESCAWCDDVHVLDSGSKDRTREIAEEMGATVHVNAFRSFGQQRNWAIDNIPVKYKWQFQVDADERFTPALVREMGALLRADGSSVDGASAYQCPSMMMFMGRWLRHAAEFPVYQCRLLNPDSCRFEDYGHGQREVNRGKTGVLRMPYMHYNFSKGLEEWFDKHNRYSSLEASQALAEPPMRTGRAIATMFRGNSVSRRRALKAISYRLPAKSLIVFFWTIVIRRGFLDGVAGWNYARMRSIYEGMMSVKVSVLKRKGESK